MTDNNGLTVPLTDNRWLYVFAKLNPGDKKKLIRYYSRIFPREYVKRLVAAIEVEDVQSKTA